MSTRWASRFVLLLAVVATIGCDRVTKYAATVTLAGAPGRTYLGGAVWLGYAENPGGFLSLGSNLPASVRTAVFTVGTGVMLFGLGVLAFRRRAVGWSALGLALFFAGGASNWIDRLVRGSVVDFLNVGLGPLRTGIFNVADVAIMVGAAIVLVSHVAHRPGRGTADTASLCRPPSASTPPGTRRDSPSSPHRPPSR